MKAQKTTLSNGLRVITVPRQESLSVNILILVEAGSKYESREEGGLSHFFEHMSFKGTNRRPRAIDISAEIDSLGATGNAFTGMEYTGYFISCLPDKLPAALDIITDIYLNSKFDPAEIEKERGVIIEEINLNEDVPMRKVGRLFMELVYGDQPAGRSILGSKATVQSIGQDNFLTYRAKHYTADRTIVTIAGNISTDQVLAEIEKQLGGQSSASGQGKIDIDDIQSGPRLSVVNNKSDQTHLILGWRSFSATDPDFYAGSLLSGVLGGGMSSRLFQRVREELGAAYYVSSSLASFTDHGIFEIAAGVKTDLTKTVVQVILEECVRLREELVSDQELNRVKDSAIGNLYLSLETPAELSDFYAFQEVLRRELLGPEEMAQRLRMVTAEDLKRVAKKIFTNDRLNLVILGPHASGEEFAAILRV